MDTEFHYFIIYQQDVHVCICCVTVLYFELYCFCICQPCSYDHLLSWLLSWLLFGLRGRCLNWLLMFVLIWFVVCCFPWQGLCQCCLCCFELSLCCLYYFVCICVALVHVVSSDKVYVSIVCFILVCVVCCDKVYFYFLCCCWSVLSYWLSLYCCCLLHFGLCCLNWLNLCCCLCKLSLSVVLMRTLLFLLFVISVNVVRNYKV